MSNAGIVFHATGVPIKDNFGNPVMCTHCGGTSWDVTLRGDTADRIECSAADCGQPVQPERGTPTLEAP